MEVLINSKSDVEHVMEIVVPSDELTPHFERAYRAEAKKISLPGFRTGKVPVQMVRKRFGQVIEYQVIEKISNDFFQQSVKERSIRPIGQPVLHDIDYKPGENLTIKISYQTAPDVVAKDYKGVQLERLTHTVTDEEIEDEIKHLRNLHRTLEEADTADEEGYLVTCDIQMLDAEGNSLPRQHNDNLKVDLGDETVNRDLKAELLNMKTGEEKDVELTWENHDGQEEVERAHVRVKKIERIILPELDDAFANTATHGGVNTVEELREDLRLRLGESWTNRYRDQLENDLINEILRRNPFEVPQMVIDEVLEGYVRKLGERQPGKKLPEDFDVAKYKESRTAEAGAVAKWMFLRDSILDQEGLKVEDADIETKVSEAAQRMGIGMEHLLEYYKNTEESTRSILIDKLMRFLLDHADIRDISDEDLSGTAMAPLHVTEHEPAQIQEHDQVPGESITEDVPADEQLKEAQQ